MTLFLKNTNLMILTVSQNFLSHFRKKRRFGRAKTAKISIEKMKEKAEEKEQ